MNPAGPATARRGHPVRRAHQATLREHNLALVLQAVVQAPAPPSRAGVAAATGLTRATVSTLVERLLAARLLSELPAEAGSVGRPAVPLVPAPRTVVGLGLEVNVDYLGVRAVDLTGATVGGRVVVDDLRGSDPTAVLGRLGDLARALLAELEADGMRVAGCRLALPGLVDSRRGRLEIAPNLGWSELDPAGLLGPLPWPVQVANEANLAGLAQLPAAPDSFVYVSADVGIGSAIVLDGAVYAGRHGWAGEIGHVTVDPDGPRCRCGARGCLEQVAGKAVVLEALGMGLAAPVGAVLDRLAAGDAEARAVVDRAGAALGVALAATVNLLDVDTVLLGGFYADLAEALRPAVAEQLRERVLAAPWERIDVGPAPVTDHAALTGAAQAVLRDVLADPTAHLVD